MLIKRIKRKIYKAFHPSFGEVWMLHRVVPESQLSPLAKQRNLEVTPDFLEQRIVSYKKKGYHFVTIDQVCDALSGRTKCIKPFVCITLDDGYADNYQYAYPIFKKHDIPFVIYITPGFVDGTIPMWWYDKMPLMMNWHQILILSNDELCTIGAHTLSHPRLGQIAPVQARQEIKLSMQIIEEKLHIKINHFSYPHGDYNSVVRQMVSDEGFKSSVLVWGGKVRLGQNPFEIPRIPIIQK